MNLKIKENSMRIPFGGHHFKDRAITFKADSFDELVEKIRDFRIANSVKVGNPEEEILIYYAKNWPWLVEEDPEPEEPTKNPRYEKWRDFIFGMKKTPIRKYANDKEIRNRYETCEKCKFRKKVIPTDKDEFEALKQKVFVFCRGSMVCGMDQFCDLHQAPIPVLLAPETTKDLIPPKDGNGSAECWIKSVP
jgi:hypothetical protein